MRNRAKCKLCKSIIESFLKEDAVSCKCGEITVAGGNYEFITFAKDYGNFLRVEDDGTEKPVKFIQKEEAMEESPKLTREELIDELRQMVKGLGELPPNAMMQPINHYDLYHYLALIVAILNEKES